MEFDEDVLLYATRYALGRQSIAVPTVIDEIAQACEGLSRRAICVLARDIGRWVLENPRHPTHKDWRICFNSLYAVLTDDERQWLFAINGGALDLNINR